MRYFLFFLTLSQALIGLSIQGRVGGFIPESSRFRCVYQTVLPDYQAELTLPFDHCLDSFVNIGFQCCNGSSDPLNIDCSLNVVPVSVGLKYNFYRCNNLSFYVGAGAAWAWLHESNDFDACKIDNHINGPGGVLKFGVQRICHCLNLGVYLDYRYQKIRSSSACVNIGGLAFGGSLGYQF